MRDVVRCRICGMKTDISGTFERSAVEVARLYPRPAESGGVLINLYGCPSCGHYQIPDINTPGYYDDFVLTGSHSPKMQDLQEEQAKTISSLAPSTDRFMDIGCGDGSFLAHAAMHFREVLGIEPSKPYFELSKKRGLNVINDYLTDSLDCGHPFDAFASRQVFEHLTDPVAMLGTIRRLLTEDGVGLIEVPNAQKIMNEGRYFDVFSDHLNYFTPASLCLMGARGGFEVIMLRESFNRDYLELYLRKTGTPLPLESKRERDIAFIKDTASRYARISAWGAGSKAQAIMTALGDVLNFEYIFDTDVHKHGRYVVNCPAEIVAPTSKTINRNDLIIIFGVSYQEEILALLRDTYHYRGDVLCLEGTAPCIVKA
jgi:SAM-dependent methyltransferase